ncbi:Sodium/calcium exchanger 3 [Bulinus truncatus]|nr:Sodium/calcium exchanger 3 [Bulinus truncatus]
MSELPDIKSTSRIGVKQYVVGQLDKSDPHSSGTADIIDVARKLAKDKSLSEDDVAQAMAAQIASLRPKPSSWYRVNATRMLTGGQKLTVKPKKNVTELLEKVKEEATNQTKSNNECLANGFHGAVSSHDVVLQHKKSVVEFTAATCSVLENEGSVRIGVKRTGDLSKEIKIGVETIDGTAEAGEDYKPIKQLLTFAEGERTKEAFVEIVDDDVWEPDEFFFVKLFHHPEGSGEDEVEIGQLGINQVTIVNDDEPGKFEFSKPSYIVKESADCASLVINRVNGADGEVEIKWTTRDLTARSGLEYAGGEGKVPFKHGETSKMISIAIYGIKDKQHEPNFQVELSNPTGGAQIGKISKAVVTLINDEEFNSMLTRIASKTKKNLDGLKLDTSTWGEQFKSAMNVNGGNLEDATRVLFACLPPPSLGGGWPTFISSLVVIALMTAIVSDMASVFGCLVGLSDYITAITLVALGTSMPDAFASKCAAINEKWADSAIGNINGSNSVNVFVGLGLPWLMACIYWSIQGKPFHHPTGTVGLSVTLFTIFAMLVLLVLILRRQMARFGYAELGGPKVEKYWTGMLPLDGLSIMDSGQYQSPMKIAIKKQMTSVTARMLKYSPCPYFTIHIIACILTDSQKLTQCNQLYEDII